jgi:ABC-type arginine/histidine transport system permease subunit
VASVRGFGTIFIYFRNIIVTLSLRSVLSRHTNARFVMSLCLSHSIAANATLLDVCKISHLVFFLQNYLLFKTSVSVAQNSKSSI